MNKILFLNLFLISIPYTFCFQGICNSKISKLNHFMKKNDLDIIKNKNIDIIPTENDSKEINLNYVSLYLNKESLKISERKHGQIAMLALFSILYSEIFISKHLIDGKGINLIDYINDNPNNILYIVILYSLYEISFRGGLPDFKTKESSLNTEIFFGRSSMLLIVSMYLYEIQYDTPVITQDLKSIIGALILYFKILFSLN
jgi:hypothetical protein